MSERGPSAEFGPHNISFIPFDRLEVLDQVRKTYPREELLDLKQSIEPDDSGRFQLLNPLIVAALNEDEYRWYAKENAQFFGEPLPTFDDAASDQHFVIIAGHRRHRAIQMIGIEQGLDPTQMKIATSLRPHISFEDALLIQIRENVHEKPPAYEEAAAVSRYVQTRRAREPKVTFKACAEAIGWKEDRLRDACRYDELPDEIKTHVKHGDLAYTVAVELWKLQDAYRESARRATILPDGFISPDELAAFKTVTRSRILLQHGLIGAKTRAKSLEAIRGWLEMAKQSNSEELQLFELTETPREHQVRVTNNLAARAIRALELGGEIPIEKMSPEAQATILRAAARLQSQAVFVQESFGPTLVPDREQVNQLAG